VDFAFSRLLAAGRKWREALNAHCGNTVQSANGSPLLFKVFITRLIDRRTLWPGNWPMEFRNLKMFNFIA
jgi:hypothetical protein